MEKSSATSPTKNSGPAAVRTPSPPAGWRPQAHPPRRSAPNGCAGTWVVPGVGSSKRRKVEIAPCQVAGAILRQAGARRHTLPAVPRPRVVPGLELCLESEAVKSEK